MGSVLGGGDGGYGGQAEKLMLQYMPQIRSALAAQGVAAGLPQNVLQQVLNGQGVSADWNPYELSPVEEKGFADQATTMNQAAQRILNSTEAQAHMRGMSDNALLAFKQRLMEGTAQGLGSARTEYARNAAANKQQALATMVQALSGMMGQGTDVYSRLSQIKSQESNPLASILGAAAGGAFSASGVPFSFGGFGKKG